MNDVKNILLIVLSLLFLTAFKNNSKTILNPDQILPGIRIANASIGEGNSGRRNIEITIILSQVSTKPVTVAFLTKDGSATAASDYITTNSTISFAPGDRMKKIAIPVIGDAACEKTEIFEILLNNPSGAIITDSIATATIVNDDCMGTVNLSFYEVRLTYKGFTTFAGTPADCPIRSNGEVILTGIVAGNEKVAPDDDVNYSGVLQLDINIDICSSKLIEDPGGGYPPCGMTVLGSGLVNTKLSVYYDQRGGYIKVENESGDYTGEVFGSCDQQQINEEKGMVPNKTIATVFNGLDLPILTARTLVVGTYQFREGTNVITVDVLSKIR